MHLLGFHLCAIFPLPHHTSPQHLDIRAGRAAILGETQYHRFACQPLDLYLMRIKKYSVDLNRGGDGIKTGADILNMQ